MRNWRPDGVPGGIRSSVGPSTVGTSNSAPRTASPTVIGTSSVRSLPSRTNNRWLPDNRGDVQIPCLVTPPTGVPLPRHSHSRPIRHTGRNLDRDFIDRRDKPGRMACLASPPPMAARPPTVSTRLRENHVPTAPVGRPPAATVSADGFARPPDPGASTGGACVKPTDRQPPLRTSQGLLEVQRDISKEVTSLLRRPRPPPPERHATAPRKARRRSPRRRTPVPKSRSR